MLDEPRFGAWVEGEAQRSRRQAHEIESGAWLLEPPCLEVQHGNGHDLLMSQRPVALDRIAREDWTAVHAWASLDQACRYQPWGPNTEAETQEFVESAVTAWSASPVRRFSYVARVEQDVVGMGELRVRNEAQRQGEISYIVHPRAWGQGIGTKIGRMLLAQGFEQLRLHRIHATCDPRNVGSSRVLSKLGMTYEGHLRQTHLVRDGWRDSLVFSIIEDEWRRPPSRKSDGLAQES